MAMRPAARRTEGESQPTCRESFNTEWYPTDGGYFLILFPSRDRLGSTLDGMNGAGLVLAILAEVEPRVGPARNNGHQFPRPRLTLGNTPC
jgi:hypothetical protein